MKLLKFVKWVLMVTSLALIYTHLQMQIFDLAYQGKIKEKKIQELADKNGRIRYNILSLKSSTNLGIKLLKEDSSMKFMDNDKIVRIASPERLVATNNLNTQKNLVKQPNSWLNFLSLRSQAEAKQVEKDKKY